MIDARDAIRLAERAVQREVAQVKQDMTNILYWAALWTLHTRFDWSSAARMDRFRVEWLRVVDTMSAIDAEKHTWLSTQDIVEALNEEVYSGGMTTEDEIIRKAGIVIEN